MQLFLYCHLIKQDDEKKMSKFVIKEKQNEGHQNQGFVELEQFSVGD